MYRSLCDRGSVTECSTYCQPTLELLSTQISCLTVFLFLPIGLLVCPNSSRERRTPRSIERPTSILLYTLRPLHSLWGLGRQVVPRYQWTKYIWSSFRADGSQALCMKTRSPILFICFRPARINPRIQRRRRTVTTVVDGYSFIVLLLPLLSLPFYFPSRNPVEKPVSAVSQNSRTSNFWRCLTG